MRELSLSLNFELELLHFHLLQFNTKQLPCARENQLNVIKSNYFFAGGRQNGISRLRGKPAME